MVPAGGITAEKLFQMMKDQTIVIIVMDARSQKDYEESHIQVPAQTCISVPEEAISPGYERGDSSSSSQMDEMLAKIFHCCLRFSCLPCMFLVLCSIPGIL